MTAIRQKAMAELQKLPDDKLIYVIQILQGMNGLYNHDVSQRMNDFNELDHMIREGSVYDDKAELNAYRDLKYGR